MSSVGAKTWMLRLLLMGLIGITGYELTKGHFKSLPIKSASLPIKYVRTEGVFQHLS